MSRRSIRKYKPEAVEREDVYKRQARIRVQLSAGHEKAHLDKAIAAFIKVDVYKRQVVGYADYKDTAQVNQYLAMKEVKEMLPKDLRLKWGCLLYTSIHDWCRWPLRSPVPPSCRVL